MNLTKNTNTRIGDLEFYGTKVITPEIAEEMLKHNFVNRTINKRRVEGYARDMKLMRWENIVDGIALQFDMEWNLLNGQHRLEAIKMSGIPMEMYIFKKNISANAMSLPFDTGAVRTLAQITKKSTNYISLATFIIRNSTEIGAQKCSVAVLTNFENSLTEDELYVLETLGSTNSIGFSAGVKAGFYVYYLQNKDKKEEIVDIWKSAITQDFSMPLANAVRTYALKEKGYGGGNTQQIKCANTYALLNGLRTHNLDYKKRMVLNILSEWAKTKNFI